MVGLSYLKHLENLSDEVLLERWVENPYWQKFCGFEYFQHTPPCDPTSLTKWRKRLGEEGAQKMLQETLRMAMSLKLVRSAQFAEVVIDTTAQEKNVTYPTDAKLLYTARKKLVQLAGNDGLTLRQSYARTGKLLAFKYGRYAHAKQLKRARRTMKKMRTQLGCVMRDIRRKVAASGKEMSDKMKAMLGLAMRVHTQVLDRKAKNKVYSLHEPHVACIAKGKAHKPFEFGSKVSVATTIQGAWVVGVKNYAGNPYDGSTTKEVVKDIVQNTGVPVTHVFADKGYRGTVHWPKGVHVLLAGRKNLKGRLQRLLKRRNAVEPVIGHLKDDHGMRRNFLKGELGDAMNATLAGAAFNLRKILRALRALFVFLLLALCALAERPQRLRAAAG